MEKYAMTQVAICFSEIFSFVNLEIFLKTLLRIDKLIDWERKVD